MSSIFTGMLVLGVHASLPVYELTEPFSVQLIRNERIMSHLSDNTNKFNADQLSKNGSI